MDTNPVERITTEATIENLRDLWDVERGMLTADKVRRATIADALVNSGVTLLSLPTRMIQELGLRLQGKKWGTNSSGSVTEAQMFDPVRLTIQGRQCTMDVVEVPDILPVIIGQLPLEHLDFVIDMRQRKLIGNPAHGGEHMYEL